MKLFVICCLYNKHISEIGSLTSFLALKNEKNVEIIIIDNSNSFIENENEKEYLRKYKNKIIYISNKDNLGLSKSYNIALEYISRLNLKHFWIMLADDDTIFSMEYFNNVWQKMKIGNAKIMTGLICSKDKILAPMKKYHAIKRKRDIIQSCGIYRNIYCINSGLFLDSDILKKIKCFDEKLFVDMVDYWLMDKLMEYGINKIEVVPGKIQQSFSSVDNFDKGSTMKRFQIFKKDFVNYCKMTHKPFYFKFIILIKRSLKVRITTLGGSL